MVCNLSAKSSYLKSENDEIGRFGPFWGFSAILRYEWLMGSMLVPEATGGA